MGCGSSKKSLPDRPSEIDCEKIKPAHRNRRNNNKTSGGKKGNNTSKTPKYRTKIDSRVLAKYDIKALIGKGSFSDVLRVENKVTKQPYAVKILRLKTANTRDLFESELAVLRRVRHPFVIQLIEVFESKDCIYLVMELATGGELYDRIKMKGHLNEKETVRVLRMVLEGVKYLHGIGVTHRDLKPENVLFYHPGHDSKILITDFGFAVSRDANDDSLFTTWCGTPEYIAPELLWKKPYTNAVDMWAIGVITYVMLSGHLPFAAENTAKLFQQIVRANYSYAKEVWKNVSSGSKNFIDKLLVIDSKQRCTAEDSLQHPWLNSFSSVFSKNSTYMKYSSQFSTTGKSGKSGKSKYSKSGRGRQRYHEDPSATMSRISHDFDSCNPEKKPADMRIEDPAASFDKSKDDRNQLNSHIKTDREQEFSTEASSPAVGAAERGRHATISTEDRYYKSDLSFSRVNRTPGVVQEEFPSAAATEGSDSMFVGTGINNTDANPFLTNGELPKMGSNKYEEMEMEHMQPDTGNTNKEGASRNPSLSRNGKDVMHLTAPRLDLEELSPSDNSMYVNHASSNSNRDSLNKVNGPTDLSPYGSLTQTLAAKRLHAKSFAGISSALKSPRLISGNKDTSFMEKVGQWLEEQRYMDNTQRSMDSKPVNGVNFVLDPSASVAPEHKKYYGVLKDTRQNGDLAVIGDPKRSKRGHYPEEGLTAKVISHFRASNEYDDHVSTVSGPGGRYPLNLSVEGIPDKYSYEGEGQNARLRDSIWKQPANGRPLTLPPLLNFDHTMFRAQNTPSDIHRQVITPDPNFAESPTGRMDNLPVRRDLIPNEDKVRSAKSSSHQPKDWSSSRLHTVENGSYLAESS